MQFKTLFLSAAAFAVACAQGVAFTNSDFNPSAGEPFDITWSGGSGPYTILLKNGDSGNLQTVSTIASGVSGTSYTWTPSSDLDTSLYALEITDSSSTVPNYSTQFAVSGATGTASPTTTTGASTETSATATSTETSNTATTTSDASTTTDSSAAASSTTATDSSTTDSASSTTDSSSTATESSSSSATDSTLSTSASRTSSQTSSTGSTSPATAAPTSSAGGLSSPLAFVFLALAAIVMLN